MASMNIYLELKNGDNEQNTPAFAHDLIKYQIEQLVIDDKIKDFEWEIVNDIDDDYLDFEETE